MNQKAKSLLEQIYDGEFFPGELIRAKDPDYLPLCREVEKAYQYLCAALNDEGKQQLERMDNLRIQTSCMDAYANFAFGFRYGALLMLEIIAGEDAHPACT